MRPSPRDLVPRDLRADWMLPATLGAGRKRALGLIADWPWIAPADLGALLGVSARQVSQLLHPLREASLVARVRGRLVLSDRGLALLARRDRSAANLALRRWSARPLDPEAPLSWRNVAGRRSRQLLRNLDHSAAVHGFVAALARQARDEEWEVAQLDPPHRASRYFRHHDRLHSVHPDAFGVLRREGTPWAFFLEWERRAVRPSTMAARLAPYLRYYASHRPTDDHGVRPTCSSSSKMTSRRTTSCASRARRSRAPASTCPCASRTAPSSDGRVRSGTPGALPRADHRFARSGEQDLSLRQSYEDLLLPLHGAASIAKGTTCNSAHDGRMG